MWRGRMTAWWTSERTYVYKCNFIILPSHERLLSSGPAAFAPRVQRHLPKNNQKKTSETKKNSTVVLAQAQITHQTCFYGSLILFVLVFFFFFRVAKSAGEDVPLWMIYKAVCISFCWHWSTYVISAHFLPQSGARFLLHITPMF